MEVSEVHGRASVSTEKVFVSDDLQYVDPTPDAMSRNDNRAVYNI